MNKKSIICHIPRPDLFRDFDHAVELSDGLVLIDHCTEAADLKTKVGVKKPSYVIIFQETDEKLLSLAENIKSSRTPIIGITYMPDDVPSFQERAYKSGVYGAYFITDAKKHDFTEMAISLSEMRSVFDTVPFEKEIATDVNTTENAQNSPVDESLIEGKENISQTETSLRTDEILVQSSEDSRAQVEDHFYQQEPEHEDSTWIDISKDGKISRYEKQALRKKQRTEEEERRQKEKNEELQRKLRKKYHISDEYTFVIERKSILEYAAYLITGLFRFILTTVLIVICAYGIICLIYPEPRSAAIEILSEIYNQAIQLLGI